MSKLEVDQVDPQSSTNLTLGTSGDTIIIPSGVTLNAGASTLTLPDDSVTLAKMASGTDGNIISYDASGNPVAVATGSDGQVLTSAGAGAVPAFEALPAGATNEGAFHAYLSTAVVNFSASTNTTVPFNAEKFDNGSNFNVSNYTYTAPSAGKYFFVTSFRTNNASLSNSGNGTVFNLEIMSGTTIVAANYTRLFGDYTMANVSCVIDLAAGAALTARVYLASSTQATMNGGSTGSQVYFSGFKLAI